MNLLKCYILIAYIIFSSSLSAQKNFRLNSPDGNIKFELKLNNQLPEYNVSYKNHLLIEHSPLSIEFETGLFGTNLKAQKTSYKTLEETYELVVGKAKKVHSKCNEIVIQFDETKSPFRKVSLAVRAFDDGLAFRYEFPKQEDLKTITLYDEKTSFNIVGNPKVLTLYLSSYQTSHEGKYTHVEYQNLKNRNLMDMPTLFEYPNNIYMSITEAAVLDYAGMYLWKEDGKLLGKLSPKLGQEQIKVEATLPHQSPWRVLMISDRVGALLESNILTNLNEPCKIEDTSWIKPGKTTFTWWNGNVIPDTTFSPGNNFKTNKYYIDFAARNHLQYHSIYGYAEQPWYVDDGFNFSKPGPHVDVCKSIAPLDMKYICDYAKSKGVGIHVWVNWKALYAKLDEAFVQFEEWGIAGMMVDFMDRDDQEMIRIQEEILEKAAKHHLFIQFHGSSKPSGLNRTYPNEFTREGTMNYEVYKWNTIINADHDISMPFTRLLAGATDYHLGGFRALPRSKFVVHYTNPFVTSTRCHMLAMYVVFESYLGMVCDTPLSYEGQPGFEFIQELPTTWDETKVTDASVNEFITIARKKDNEWYVGTLNNSEQRTLELPLEFLGKGKYTAAIYTDARDANTNPNHLVIETKTVDANDLLVLPLASDGGAVVRLTPL